MRPVALLCASAFLLVTAGCSGAGSPDAGLSASLSQKPATAAARTAPPKELGSVKASGFGQRQEFVWATAIVHNNSDLVGQTVTVNFNVFDGQDNLLKSESQVESFYKPSADHAVGTQITLERGQKAAKVEATVDVDTSGTFSDKVFPSVKTSPVKVGKGPYGQDVASFEITNPLTVALKSPRVQVVCASAKGVITGGSSTYPELVPAKGRVKVDADVTVSGKPASCSVYVAPPMDWDGEGTDALPEAASTSTPASVASSSGRADGSAQAAFKVWMNQFNDKDWADQYDTLVTAQQAVISKRQYIRCRAQNIAPTFKWVKLLSVTDAGATSVPGTKVKLPSTKVRVQVSVMGAKAPVDAHMYDEDGRWKWSMTQQNLDGCL